MYLSWSERVCVCVTHTSALRGTGDSYTQMNQNRFHTTPTTGWKDGWTCSAQLATLGARYTTAIKDPFTAQEVLHSSENYSQEGVLVKEGSKVHKRYLKTSVHNISTAKTVCRRASEEWHQQQTTLEAGSNTQAGRFQEHSQYVGILQQQSEPAFAATCGLVLLLYLLVMWPESRHIYCLETYVTT